MARKGGPVMDIDRAIAGCKKMLASKKVNAGMKAYQKTQLEKLETLKSNGAERVTLAKGVGWKKV